MELGLALPHGSSTIINLTPATWTAVDDVIQFQHCARGIHGSPERDGVACRVAPCKQNIGAVHRHVKAVAIETVRDKARITD